MFPNADWLEVLLAIPFMLAFWWVIRRDMSRAQRLWDAEARYNAARAARRGDHD